MVYPIIVYWNRVSLWRFFFINSVISVRFFCFFNCSVGVICPFELEIELNLFFVDFFDVILSDLEISRKFSIFSLWYLNLKFSWDLVVYLMFIIYMWSVWAENWTGVNFGKYFREYFLRVWKCSWNCQFYFSEFILIIYVGYVLNYRI